jgi:hypothetical protein
VAPGTTGSEDNRPDELIRGFICAGQEKSREVMNYLAGLAAVCVLELADERGVSFDDVLDRTLLRNAAARRMTASVNPRVLNLAIVEWLMIPEDRDLPTPDELIGRDEGCPVL